MSPDLPKYRPYVEAFDLSEEQKAELIHTIWAMMESFIDRAFAVDREASARIGVCKADSPPQAIGIGCSSSSIQEHFAHAAPCGVRKEFDDDA